MIQMTVFYEQLEQVLDHLPKYHMEIWLGDFNAKWGGRIFSNRQLGMRVYIRIVKTIVLEWLILSHEKIWVLRAQCSCTENSIRIPGPLVMGRLTTRMTTY